jgi:MFS transporter, DHA3 family, macrolide efflux protein
MNQQKTTSNSLKVFGIIWFGQLVSTIGSGLTGFALGIWIYDQTGSTTMFAMNVLSYTLPTLILSPIAGAIVDRWDRRWVMLLSDTGAGFCTLAVWLLLLNGNLDVWHIYVTSALISVFNTFQLPAYSASTTLLVPKKHLGRAGGMVQIGEALSQLIAPIAAGALFMSAGLNGIVLIDFITFGFAVLTLLFVRIPKPVKTAEAQEGQGSLLKEAIFGWKYIVTRKGLLSILLYFAAWNLVTGFFGPLTTPMMLEYGEPDTIGVVFSIVGVGMLVGTIIMSIWGGPQRRVLGILTCGALMGVFVIIFGFQPSLIWIAVGGFLFMALLPIANGASQALWQSKTAPDIQGRVFAARQMIARFTQPVSIIIAGPLVDQVFQPLMNEGGPLAGNIGQLIGVGPGRGTGLFFIILGAFMILVTLISYMYPPLQNVEDDLPDYVTDKQKKGTQNLELDGASVPAD